MDKNYFDTNNIDSLNRKRRFWLITIAVFFGLAVILSFVVYRVVAEYLKEIGPSEAINTAADNAQDTPSEEEVKCQDCVRRRIDGVYVKEGEENLSPTAVIIENHTDSRPPSGLARANLVYEAEAEGGITRFLAIFADGEDIKAIGPVRSVRPYFVDWARELSALLVHVGGSPEALVKISKTNAFNLNEFYKGWFFWRENGRSAPHNVYTSSDNIKKYFESADPGEAKFLSWQFKDDAELEDRPEAGNIEINFKTPYYRVLWKYNRDSNDYGRYLAGKVHLDKSGEYIKAKNIAVEFVEAEVIDDKLRLKMETIGEGGAIVCRDGVCQEGIWRKKSASGRTRFFSESGGEIKFNAGTTWIEAVRPEVEVLF